LSFPRRQESRKNNVILKSLTNLQIYDLTYKLRLLSSPHFFKGGEVARLQQKPALKGGLGGVFGKTMQYHNLDSRLRGMTMGGGGGIFVCVTM